ncbi:UNVERIFIED_CONTAM: hypothetical protein Sradi_5820700 [Sesamum radiatum]|uniref:Myb/SANT-like domain-containing protein n=1 Tax=Sesamum radiatum TaxID=300843 RepID=A0AAW2KR59_SESRA
MARARKPKAQSYYFCSTGCMKDQDTTFINMLAWQGDKGQKQANPNQPNKYSLVFASKVVDTWSAKVIPMETYTAKLHNLRMRFDTFKRILDNLAFEWNPCTNRVIASNEDW